MLTCACACACARLHLYLQNPCTAPAYVRLLSPHQELGSLPFVGWLPTDGFYGSVDLRTDSGKPARYTTSLLDFGGQFFQQGEAFDAHGALTFMVLAPLVKPMQTDSDADVGAFVRKCPASMLRRGR